MPVRAGIYTRPQYNEKGDVVNDPMKQEETCRKHANKQGYVVAQVYREEENGVEAERPGLRRLRSSIWTRRLDVVIATTRGIAKPSACGQAMTNTVATRSITPTLKPVAMDQAMAVSAATPRAT